VEIAPAIGVAAVLVVLGIVVATGVRDEVARRRSTAVAPGVPAGVG